MVKAENLRELFQEGLEFHNRGKLEQARACYARVLAIDPNDFDSLHMLGASFIQQGDASSGLPYIERAVAILPLSHQAHFNMGNAWYALTDYKSALVCYERATEIFPNDPEYHFETGNTLCALQNWAAALKSYEKSLTLDPGFAKALYRAGLALQELKRFDEAISAYTKVIELAPRSKLAHLARADLLSKLGRYREALYAFTMYLEKFPKDENAYLGKAICLSKLGSAEECSLLLSRAQSSLDTSPTFNYQAAALRGEALTTAPREYVKSLFDGYAEGFERHLVEELSYNSPSIMYEHFKSCFSRVDLDCLDLGCGTGLGVIAYRSSIRHAVGVDLSENMIIKAQEKNIYDRLVCSEILDFLEQTADTFDLVLAFDLFIYVGDLRNIFDSVKRVLRPAGIFAFTVERAEIQDVELKTSARFGHSKKYLQQLAREQGFAIMSFEDGSIRKESGASISGYLVHMQLMDGVHVA